MGEEVRMSDYYEASGEEGDRVPDWEIGLPSDEDLASLSYSLIPPNLAMAFSITPENIRTVHDVNLASETTLSSLLRSGSSSSEEDRVGSGSDSSKKQKTSDEEEGSETVKRQRLVWTPQLHKRFVEVVAHLGIKNAVPKTIMELMNVEGLSRENVASHLQKYRLYLKRMQGFATEEGPPSSSSDKLFSSSTPVPMMMQMPVYAHHMGLHLGHHPYHNNESGGPDNAYMMHQNKFGSMASYPPVGGGSTRQ